MLYLIVAPRITPITLRVGVFKGVVAAVAAVGVVVVGDVDSVVARREGKAQPILSE